MFNVHDLHLLTWTQKGQGQRSYMQHDFQVFHNQIHSTLGDELLSSDTTGYYGNSTSSSCHDSSTDPDCETELEPHGLHDVLGRLQGVIDDAMRQLHTFSARNRHAWSAAV